MKAHRGSMAVGYDAENAEEFSAAGGQAAAVAGDRVPAFAGDGDSVPPGWTFYEPTGRHLDPNDMQTWGKIPRNATCPCGSGKKFKSCHGRLA